MGAASWNMAGKPPEITLPAAAKTCSFHPSEIMNLDPLFIMADEKGTSYSSVKKCDKNATTRKCMRSCYMAKWRKNIVKSCVSQRIGAQKSIEVSSFNQRARDSSSLRQSGPGWWLWTTTRFAEQSDRPSDRDFQALKIMVIKWIFVTNQ